MKNDCYKIPCHPNKQANYKKKGCSNFWDHFLEASLWPPEWKNQLKNCKTLRTFQRCLWIFGKLISLWFITFEDSSLLRYGFTEGFTILWPQRPLSDLRNWNLIPSDPEFCELSVDILGFSQITFPISPYIRAKILRFNM